MGEIKLAAILAAVVAAFVAYKAAMHREFERGKQECEQAHQAADAQALREQAIRTDRRIEANADLASKIHQREAEFQARIIAERATSSSLRDRLAAVEAAARADPAASAVADGTTTAELARLLGQSIELVQRGGEVAGQLAGQVEGLQRYVREVCLDTKASKVQQ